MKKDGVLRYAFRLFLRLLAVTAFCALLICLIPFNYTPSLPYGFYLRIPAWNIKVGDYVEIDNPLTPEMFGVNNTTHLMKRVVSIQDGLYEVRGTHERSFDSRYFGLIGREYIHCRMVPLVTFDEIPSWLLWISEFLDIRKGEN